MRNQLSVDYLRGGKKADEASELVADNTTGTSSQLSCETEKINK